MFCQLRHAGMGCCWLGSLPCSPNFQCWYELGIPTHAATQVHPKEMNVECTENWTACLSACSGKKTHRDMWQGLLQLPSDFWGTALIQPRSVMLRFPHAALLLSGCFYCLAPTRLVLRSPSAFFEYIKLVSTATLGRWREMLFGEGTWRQIWLRTAMSLFQGMLYLSTSYKTPG